MEARPWLWRRPKARAVFGRKPKEEPKPRAAHFDRFYIFDRIGLPIIDTLWFTRIYITHLSWILLKGCLDPAKEAPHRMAGLAGRAYGLVFDPNPENPST